MPAPARPSRRGLIPVRARVAVAAATAALVAACGGGDGGASVPPGEADVTIVSTGLSFDPDRFEVPAGEVTVVYENLDDGVPHNIAFRDIEGARTPVEVAPVTQALTFTVAPGEYTYVCDIHLNMQGTMTVTG